MVEQIESGTVSIMKIEVIIVSVQSNKWRFTISDPQEIDLLYAFRKFMETQYRI